MNFPFRRYIFILLCFAFSLQAFAQKDSLKITRISRNDSLNLLDIYINAPPGPNVKINANTIRFLEQVPKKGLRECRLDILGFTESRPEGFVQESVTILFLLDYSGSMKTEDRLGKSKTTIKEVISQISLPAGSKFELAAFHDSVFTSVEIDKHNIDAELAKYPTPIGGGKDTDLFRAMIEKIDELSINKGKKILVLLSDGRNDNLRNPYYRNNNVERPTANDVYKKIKFVDLTNELMVLTYGIGNGIDSTFLKELPSLTEAIEDKHYFISDPRNISQILVDQLSEFNNDYLFHVRPSCNEYRGELRNLLVEWKSTDKGNVYDQREYKLGASIEPEYIGVLDKDRLNWFLLLVIGLALVFGVLFLLIYLLPKLKRREFIKKHVVKYKPEPNKIKRDPITQDIIQEGDKVVVCSLLRSIKGVEKLFL
jgi:Na+-transporting methylmalonyl-CoA/oxaloacetate decarboxylase gamma subunit